MLIVSKNRCVPALRTLATGTNLVSSSSSSSTTKTSTSHFMKPPNILIFGQDVSVWKCRIEQVVNTNQYLVYATSQNELESDVWVDNCRLLYLADVTLDQCTARIRGNLKKFIANGGSVVVNAAAEAAAAEAAEAAEAAGTAIEHVDDLSKVEVLKDDGLAGVRVAFESLGICCDNESSVIQKTEGYLVSDKWPQSFFNGSLPQEQFRISDEVISGAAFTPIRIGRPDKSKFNVDEYFQYLTTRELGRTLLYIENASSTMISIKTIESVHGAVSIASRQLSPMARGRNSWISPPGCAMYSVVVNFRLQQKLADKLSFLQHIAALSIVRAIRLAHPSLEVSIKWPNDIYFRREAKIGGILSTCTVKNNSITCTLGCGVNISNSEPLRCVHELAQSSELTVERLISTKLSELERLLDLYESDSQKVLNEYHANWLHSGEEVFVEAIGERAIIQSVDEHGFLQAKICRSGQIVGLQPDGNSFDLMKGLIFTKR